MSKALKTDKKPFYRLLIIMSVFALALMSITAFLFYHAVISERQEDLLKVLKIKAVYLEKSIEDRVNQGRSVDEEFLDQLSSVFLDGLRYQDIRGENFGATTVFRAAGQNLSAQSEISEYPPVALLYHHPAAPDLSLLSQHQPTRELLRNAFSGDTGSTTYKDENGDRILAAHTTVEGLNMVLLMQNPVSNVFSIFDQIYLISAFFILAIVILTGMFFLRLSTPLINRLQSSIAVLNESQRIGKTGNWSWDISKRKYFFSDEAVRIFGIDKDKQKLDSVLGERLALTKSDRKKFGATLLNSKVLDVNHAIKWPDGSEHTIRIRAEQKKVVNGVELVMGTVQDITEFQNMNIALNRSEQRFRSITENSIDITLILSESGDHSYASPSFYKALGVDTDSIIGKNIDSYVHSEEINEVLQAISTCAGDDSTVTLRTFRCRKADGSWLTMVGGFTGMTKVPGVEGVVAHFRNVTEQRVIEQSMRTLSSAIEQSNSAVMITDKRGLVEYVNPRYTEITGYTAQESVGETPTILKSSEFKNDENKKLWDSINAGDSWSATIDSKRKDGEEFWQLISAAPIRSANGDLKHIVLGIEDITEQRETHARMEQLAYYDDLTGLENRRLFKDRLDQCLKHVRRHNKNMALLFLDLDQFKRFNDTLGHEAGDELLCTAAKRLKLCVREEDIVCRLGGDEFTILLPEIADTQGASAVASKILASLSQPVELGGQMISITVSIGITLAPFDSMNPGELMRNADLAMYSAKDRGRNNYQFFTDDMNIESVARMALENEMRLAISNDDFVCHFQPQVNLSRQEVCGFETLLRWEHAEVDIIPPDRFIPIAEETGMILELGKFVLQQSCKQIKLLHEQGFDNTTIAVNLSARQFRDQNLTSLISAAIEETGIEGKWLELEITESMLMDNIEQAIEILNQLKDLGVSVAIDDFGTGYSSLSYLTRLPVDKLKVDRSFVRNLAYNKSDMAIVSAVIVMAQKLDMEVVAEGVEDQQQLDFLTQNQCDVVQGYFFSRPVPAEELAERISSIQIKLGSAQPINQN